MYTTSALIVRKEPALIFCQQIFSSRLCTLYTWKLIAFYWEFVSPTSISCIAIKINTNCWLSLIRRLEREAIKNTLMTWMGWQHFSARVDHGLILWPKMSIVSIRCSNRFLWNFWLNSNVLPKLCETFCFLNRWILRRISYWFALTKLFNSWVADVVGMCEWVYSKNFNIELMYSGLSPSQYRKQKTNA